MECPACSAPVAENLQFCNECGAPVNSGRDAILGGRKVSAGSEPLREAGTTQTTSKLGAILVLAGIALVLGALGTNPSSGRHAKLSYALLAAAAISAIAGAVFLITNKEQEVDDNPATSGSRSTKRTDASMPGPLIEEPSSEISREVIEDIEGPLTHEPEPVPYSDAESEGRDRQV